MRLVGRRILAALVALLLGTVAGITFTTTQAPRAEAAATGLEGFDPGNLISDASFYNANALSAQGVADFIAMKGAKCVNNSSTGVPCMKNYRQNTPKVAATAYCAALEATSNSSAASIISRVTKACRTSPAAMLVLIQKESALLTASGSALTKRKYAAATGAGCPDFARCDPTLANFFNQVYKAAHLFSRWRAEPSRLNYPVGVNKIQYHPKTSCGRATVNVKNVATGSLYTYTPYVPNAAALKAVSGEGDSCSAYGNRNFYRLMKLWFPSAMNSSTASPIVPGGGSSGSTSSSSSLSWTKLTATGKEIAATRITGGWELLRIGTDGQIYRRTYIGGTPSDWVRVTSQKAVRIAATTNSAGLVELFFVGTDKRVYHLTESSRGGAYKDLTSLGGDATDVAAARSGSGWVVVQLQSDGSLSRATSSDSAWKSVGGTATAITAATGTDGLARLYRVSGGTVYRAQQTDVGAGFGGWSNYGGTDVVDISVAYMNSATTELYSATKDGKLWRRAPALGHTRWVELNGSATRVAATVNSSGTVDLVRITSSGSIYRVEQRSPGSF